MPLGNLGRGWTAPFLVHIAGQPWTVRRGGPHDKRSVIVATPARFSDRPQPKDVDIVPFLVDVMARSGRAVRAVGLTDFIMGVPVVAGTNGAQPAWIGRRLFNTGLIKNPVERMGGIATAHTFMYYGTGCLRLRNQRGLVLLANLGHPPYDVEHDYPSWPPSERAPRSTR